MRSTTTWSRLLEYPGAEFPSLLVGTARQLRGRCPEAAALLDAAREEFARLCSYEIEELYTQTFDVTPSCVAYVSIHLFGEENFKRGEFMARLRERYAEIGFEAGSELPDHLRVLLRFAAVVDEEERRELYRFCLLAPLARMIRSLDAAQPYALVLRAIEVALKAEFPDIEPAPLPVDQMRQGGVLSCSGITPLGCSCGSTKELESSTHKV